MFSSKPHPGTWMASLRLCCLVAALVTISNAQPPALLEQTMYTFEVLEEQPDGAEVDVVQAVSSLGLPVTDGTYSISNQLHFAIGSSTGVISTVVVFNRDAPDAVLQYSFTVQYTTADGAYTTPSSTVIVNIQDVNDNPPVFTQPSFTAEVFEKTSPGTGFFNVTATDVDQVLSERDSIRQPDGTTVLGPVRYLVTNGRITYSIVDGNELGHFDINNETGTLLVGPGADLDVDNITQYNLTVMIVDGGGLNDTADVTVIILDANDNAPEITYPVNYSITVREDVPVGFVILDGVNATDVDFENNSEIEFLIISGDQANRLMINSVTGEVQVASSLDREVNSILLITIAASDLGTPQLQDTVDITINLTDINDFVPVFVNHPYVGSVTEEQFPMATILTVEADDLDEGSNGNVSYSIVWQSSGQFSIDPVSGVLRTNGTLDREEAPIVTVTIAAFDNPVNSTLRLSSQINVTVNVQDINDNSPTFGVDEVTAGVLVTATIGTVVTTLQATDSDDGNNAQVRYEKNSGDTTFIIMENGTVTLNGTLDFSTQVFYNYVVRVWDFGTPPRFSDTPFVVQVHDINRSPPRLQQRIFTVNLTEDAPIGMVILRVNATDRDSGLTGLVRYRIITPFDAAGSFDVNSTSGEVFSNTTLDYDVKDTIWFQVEAYDGGFPEPRIHRANVTIYLSDVNDRPPDFLFPPGYEAVVVENAAPGVIAVNLTEFTTDVDTGDGGLFNLTIITNISDFILDSDGIITSNATFDRESVNAYIITIEGVDFGVPQQRSTYDLTIAIGDVNDNSPFYTSNISGTVIENNPIGTEVIPEYRAMDIDIGINAELRYGIFSGDPNRRFAINQTTGAIYTAQILNKTGQEFYSLTIVVTDGGEPQLFGYGLANITVLDFNDNPPVFASDVLQASVMESAEIGDPFYTIEATDDDLGSNAILEYFIIEDEMNISNRFSVNQTTGVLHTNDTFDRESEYQYNITIMAVDNGVIPLSATAIVTITILDSNDFPPVFNSSNYSTSVVENSEDGTFVLQVFATDEDVDFHNRNFSYTISGNRSMPFRIVATTGELFVEGEVDWESGDYEFLVHCSDNGDPPLMDESIVFLTVIDVNDRVPQFTQQSYQLAVLENLPPGSTVGNLTAEDMDSSGNNSVVSYSILMEFSTHRINFIVDNMTGLVTTNTEFNFERRTSYDLLVRAEDHGTPSLRNDTIITIAIIDSNDHDPVFVNDTFVGSIPEDVMTDTAILTLRATDNDVGSNQDLRYSVNSTYFDVNSTTGVLFTAVDTFDRELAEQFVFIATVHDLGIPSRSATTTIIVNIIDVNDNDPVFDQPSYSASLEENLAIGTVVTRVLATDADLGVDGVISYYLEDVSGSQNFGINNETGVIYTARYIDREVYPSIDLVVIANNSFSTRIGSTPVTVSVEITDINDQHPSFSSTFIDIYISENSTLDCVVYSISVTDSDLGEGGRVNYAIVAGNSEGIFSVNETTGGLSLNSVLDYETKSLYSIAVQAYDNGIMSLSNYTTFLVHVVDSNDNIPYFALSQYEISISFGVLAGSEVLRLALTDVDTNHVQFYIEAGDNTGSFSIDYNGILRTRLSITGLQGQTIDLTIRAFDGLYNVSTNVMVHVTGLLNIQFTSPTFTCQFSENVIHSATTCVGASFHTTLAIVAQSNTSLFSIDNNGAINVLEGLDYEHISVYQLVVQASSATETAYTVVTIMVEDVDEFGPIFVTDSYYVVLPETYEVGKTFLNVTALDNDGAAPNNVVTYEITAQNPFSDFSINRATGAVRVSRQLDYESSFQRDYNLSITATNNAGGMVFTDTVTVRIFVTDDNDNTPSFNRFAYSQQLPEDAEVGIAINHMLFATDSDFGSNTEITYALTGNHKYTDFSINTITGEVHLSESLDWERQTSYTLELHAADRGNPGNEATASISITVQDLNDNDPVWERDLYFVVITEHVSVNTTIIDVQATDADQIATSTSSGTFMYINRNGLVTYNITAGDPLEQFHIHNETGNVTVIKPLNREEHATYNITLNATDGGGRYTNAYLYIELIDENDNVPVFLEDVYNFTVVENSMSGALVGRVIATDSDVGHNGNITYSIISGNTNSTFRINATIGEISLMGEVDREIIEIYLLVVRATDYGLNRLSSDTLVNITVTDVNEFPPVFTELFYFGEVHENRSVGYLVLTVSTTDEDSGDNSLIKYQITDGNDLLLFYIGIISGEILVNREIDYEAITNVTLELFAEDSGAIDMRLNATVFVYIDILDVNDNAPQFINQTYSGFVLENSVAGTEIITISATDADSNENGEIVYLLQFLSNDTESPNNFGIDPVNGTVFLLNTVNLDRERTSAYEMIVTAIDNGEPSLSTNVTLMIVVVDVNDNAPQFQSRVFAGGITENLPANSSVRFVNATDIDEGENSQIVYSLNHTNLFTQDCASLCPQTICDDIASRVNTSLYPPYPLFAIDNVTGEIISTSEFDREYISDYLLLVEAEDQGTPTQYGYTCVQIMILDENDNNPFFSQPLYEAQVNENANYTEVTQLLASDLDTGNNAVLAYGLSDVTNSFTIDPLNGTIHTIRPLDRELQDVYNITVFASDGGNPSRNGMTVVKINVLDLNDNPPQFTLPQYNSNVAENVTTGTSFAYVLATDDDIGFNSAVVYAIDPSSINADHFTVNATTGDIYVAETLDYENIQSYNITVTATDGGVPSLSSRVTLTINVVDINDNPPVFINVPYFTSVTENLNNPISLLSVAATDNDSGSNSEIFYRISSVYPLSNAFSINSSTGEVIAIEAVDAEYSLEYAITVSAANSIGHPYLSTEGNITVLVNDVNDNVPMFDFPTYTIPISESTVVGDSIFQVTANDLDATDNNSNLTYQLTASENTSLLFTIEQYTGIIRVADILDREATDVHVLNITAYDVSNFTDTTVVTIHIEDSNDNSPIFEQAQYIFSFEEDEPVDISVGRVIAHDADLENISYFISENSSLLFTVNALTGELFTNATFDREASDTHIITVVATDNGIAEERSSMVEVMFIILDINDENPVFNESFYKASWHEEVTSVGTNLLNVSTYDRDIGNNSDVSYALVASDDADHFEIDSDNGIIYLSENLDREIQDIFIFTVVATDGGIPPLTGVVNVTVIVLDINDNFPIFNASNYTSVLLEDTSVGTEFLAVGTTDIDIDENAEVTYFIVDDFNGTFTINNETGVISLTESLDYEDTQYYELNITAVDRGGVPLLTPVMVYITVVDLNDNPPVLNASTYYAAIPENAILGTPVFEIPATDEDSTSNGQLRYYITSGNSEYNFELDEDTGVLIVDDYLDREITDFYSITFTVVDLGPIPFSALATLEIEVEDVNDNSPMFSTSLYQAFISEAAAINHTVFSLNAIDNDIGSNAELTYIIISGDYEGLFYIDPSTSTIRTASLPDHEIRRSYTLSIVAQDDGQPMLSDVTNLHIVVTDHNEHSPTFQQNFYQVDISTTIVVGSPIIHLVAIDDDYLASNTIVYSIADGNHTLLFSISQNGTIHVRSSLVGMEGEYELTIEASDGTLYSGCAVTINVLSTTSTTPLFQPPTQLIFVPENTNLLTVVAAITTIPSDTQVSIYVNDTTVTRDELFTVETLFQITNDGRLQVIGNLDREEFPVYVIPLQATATTGTSYSTVTVVITDVNDNAPMADNMVYNVTLSESTAIGSPVLTIFGTDPDLLENSDFEYSITSGNHNGFFILHSLNGEITVVSILDRELESNPCLQITLRNYRSFEQLTSQTKVNIIIEDVNDNSPEFSSPFNHYVITDDATIGTFVGEVAADDPDSGSNAELVYSITHQTQPNAFEINQSTGGIYVSAPLDSRNVSRHVLSLEVTDRGSPIPRRSPSTAFIDVLPVNNFAPMFLQSGYDMSIPETLDIGILVLTVEAIDPDFNSSESIRYEFISGNEGEDFIIQSTTGNILVQQRLDYQAHSNYSLIVAALDMGTPVLNTTVPVNIVVQDINTHPPVFTMSQYEVCIMENITVGTPVLNITATDVDAIEILYYLTQNAYIDGSPLFSIDQQSGVLSVVHPVDREIVDFYELMVSAIDSGYDVVISRTVSVIVTLLDINDNTPFFSQSNYAVDATRLLPPNQCVFQTTTIDADLMYNFSYSIIGGNDDDLFYIDDETGKIFTNSTIPETGMTSYEIVVEVDDGVFISNSTVTITLTSNGSFCEGDLCTTVIARSRGRCPNGFVLTPFRRHCWQLYCNTSSAYRPCNETRSCIPVDNSCEGSCPNGMGLCPTTDLCHDLLPSSPICDGSDVTCLIGQTLYQNIAGDRHCVRTTTLPISQRNCTGSELVFCEQLNGCSNLTAPHLCMPCPSHLVYCNDTRVCVDDVKRCCGSSGYFCDILDTCLTIGVTCELPNIAPEVTQDLIFIEEITSFDNTQVYSSSGHVVGLLLSANNTLAVDTQGEELGIAVTGVPDIDRLFGEWQYSLCDDSATDDYGNCSVITSEWFNISTSVNDTNALFLPNNARIRFVRKSVEIEGAVWIRAKLWDGNSDGFISNSSTLVRNQIPHFNSTLPFNNNSGVSQSSTLITVLFIPLAIPPEFSPDAHLTFVTITEEERFVDNNGNTIEELVISVNVPSPVILDTTVVIGFPSPPAGNSFTSYQNQLPSDVLNRYFAAVAVVNPIRSANLDALMNNQLPGVGLSHVTTNDISGRWQVSLNGSLFDWVYLDTIIDGTSQYVLLGTSDRLRFVPAVDFYGQASIRIRPWDGLYSNSRVTRNERFIVVMDNLSPSSSSQFGINEWQVATINVLSSLDRPIAFETTAYLDPIPNFIMYKYDRFFTVQVDRDVESVRVNRATLENYLQVVFIDPVTIARVVPAQNESCLVSFSIQQDVLSFSEVQQHLLERNGSLEALGFPILKVSQDVSYGTSYGCPDAVGPLPHYGTHVNQFVSRFARDGDEDFLGLAVISINSTEGGVWQYYRGDLNDYNNPDNTSSYPLGYQSHKIPWVNFPPGLAENNALLLQGIDRIRFVPRPNYYWINSSVTPSITVKIWDASVNQHSTSSSELDLMNINTNPYEDTLQSLVNPVGLFSLEKVFVLASRYGCNGIVNSGVTYDACCVCGGSGGTCTGCDGRQNSNAIYDSCDICQGNDQSCLGCDYVPYSSTEAGSCSECISEVEINREQKESQLFTVVTVADFIDCAGACFGPAIVDECMNCSGGNSSRTYNQERDCAGVCYGPAMIDDCGYCTGESTDLVYNELLDCTGICDGPFRADSCGICQRPDDNDNIVEHRDCNGVCFGTALLDSCDICYGEDTNNTADTELDVCGVCFGDNSTCTGCDGVTGSGFVIDTCGECGNNDCGCNQINSITPNRGPSTGGTQLTVRGAGFFLNNETFTRYNPQAPNCGAPTVLNTTGDVVFPVCQFRSGDQQFSTVGIIIDHTTVLCTTADTTGAELVSQYQLQVSVQDGPPTPVTINAIFYNDDYSNILITEMVPVWNVLGSSTMVSFLGHNYTDTGFVSCIAYGLQRCQSSSADSQEVYPAVFISSTRVDCEIPPVDTPCQASIRLTLDGQPSGQAIRFTNGVDFVFTFFVPAPIVSEAYFSDDMTTVYLDFDQRIELIDMTLSCENIFTPATLSLLGTDPACLWSSSSFDQVTIIVPSDAQLTSFTPVGFKDNVIRASGKLYARNITNYSIFVGGGTKPVAIIEGPDNIPMCGSVTFTGRQSLHAGYGDLQYSWSISVLDSATSGFDQIQNYLNGLTPQNDAISLDTAYFIQNVEYFIQLTVTNSIGLVSDTVRVRLTKQEVAVPQIQLVGSKMKMLSCGDSAFLQVEVSDLSCGGVSGAVSYEWSLYVVEKSKRMAPVLQDTSSLKTSSPLFYVPANLLNCNYTYIAVVTATIGLASSSNNFTLTVSPVRLTAHIFGGNRTVARHRDLILDATQSIIVPNLGPVSYSWSCINTNTNGPCYVSGTGNESVIDFSNASDIVSIPASLFTAGITYAIQLTMMQGNSVSRETVQIRFVGSTPPIVEIVVPVNDIFPVTERIILEGLVFSIPPTRRVTWQCIELPGQVCVSVTNTSIAQLQVTYNSFSLTQTSDDTDLTQQYIEPNQTSRVKLVLNPNVLIAGFSYTFRLLATNSLGQGYSQITITPTSPPTTGYVNIQPTTGNTLTTEFTITCSASSTTEEALPLEYQYGIVTQTGNSGSLTESDIQWLTGRLRTEQHKTLLPTSNMGDSTTIVVRVSNRYGASTDLFGTVHVSALSVSYPSVLTSITNNEQRDKSWTTALSSITVLLLELSQSSNSFITVRRSTLSAILTVFESSLIPTKSHQIHFTTLLSYLTGDRNVIVNDIDRVSAAMNLVVSNVVTYDAAEDQGTMIAISSNNEPVSLVSASSPVVQNYNMLTEHEADLIFTVWSDLIIGGSTSGMQYRNTIDRLGLNVCQSKVQGEDPSVFQSSEVLFQVSKSLPFGRISLTGGASLVVNSTLLEYYINTQCTRTTGCEDICTMVVASDDDVLAIDSSSVPNRKVLQLNTVSIGVINRNIAYVDTAEIQPYSQVISFSLLDPVRAQSFEISDLQMPYAVQIPLQDNTTENGTQLLCLYRQPGEDRWQLDSLTPPHTFVVDYTLHAVCEYNHLTDFIIGLLPAPVTPTPTPTPTPVITSTSTTTSSTTTTVVVVTTSTAGGGGGGGGGAGAAAAAVVVVLLVVVVVVVVIIVAVLWRNKRKKRRVDVTKDVGLELQEDIQTVKTALLTPEEAKVLMQIIKIAEGGQKERELFGSLNVLPSMRLRELRNQLFDNFDTLKNKPFYFLTKQLCDIEPAAEQMQFVNLVYDKTIFIREAEANTERSRRHFCICGLAAQFECSQCMAQGYCSPECQYKHWTEEHGRDCRRLAERKRRTNILSRRQTPTSPLTDLPPVQPGSLVQQGKKFSLTSMDNADLPVSPPPKDFRSLLMAKRASTKSFGSVHTSLGDIASRGPKNEANTLSGIGVERQQTTNVFSTAKPSPGQPVAVFNKTSTTKLVNPQLMLSSKPLSPQSSQQSLTRGLSNTSIPATQATPQVTPQAPQITSLPRTAPQFTSPARMASILSADSLSQSQPAAMLKQQPTLDYSMTSEQLGNSFTSQNLPPTPQTSDGGQFFSRKTIPHQATPRKLVSTLSVQSVDLDASGHLHKSVRDQPLLESDEDDYEETSSSSESLDDENISSSRPISRKPPSLTRRSTAMTSRLEKRETSSESSSRESESETESSSENEDDDDQTKLVGQKSGKRSQASKSSASKTKTEQRITESASPSQPATITKELSEEDELKDDKGLQDDKELTSDEDTSRV